MVQWWPFLAFVFLSFSPSPSLAASSAETLQVNTKQANVILLKFFSLSGSPDYPCRVNAVPRPIPEKKWFMEPWVIVALGGVLPFGSIFIEMYFIFTSFWAYKIYYVYGFMLLGSLHFQQSPVLRSSFGSVSSELVFSVPHPSHRHCVRHHSLYLLPP